MDFEINGIKYTCVKLNAILQFHIMRRLAPLLSGLAPLASLSSAPAGATIDEVKHGLSSNPESLEKALAAIGGALAALSNADAEYVLHGLLAAVNRHEPHGLGQYPVAVENRIMYQDITMPEMLQLAWKAIQFNFSNFFNGLPSILSAAAPKANGQ